MRRAIHKILLLVVPVVLITLAGCTRRELINRPGEAYLKIELDWRTFGTPAGTGYYFYSDRGGEPIYYEGTGDGLEGYVPTGNYRVIMYNTDPVGAEVRSTGVYENDYFAAKSTQKRDLQYIECVENVFGTTIAEVTIPRYSTEPIIKKATPAYFVRRVNYVLDIETSSEVSSMTVYQGGAVTDKCIATARPFSGNCSTLIGECDLDEKDGTYRTQVTALDFLEGCILTAEVNFKDGTTATTIPVDLTTRLVKYQEDDIDIYLVLRLDNGEEIKATVKVKGWKLGGSGGGVIQ